MTRVLQIMAGARHGGAEAFYTRLVLALSRVGVEQRAVIRRHEERAAGLRDGGVDTVELAFGGALDFLTSWQMARQVTDFQPDIVLSWMNRATAKTPRGDFVHVARLGGYYDLKYYKKCDHLIGNTPGIVAYLLEQGWPEARAHYLPNFVDAEATTPVDRASLATPADAKVLLALGRLHTNKGFDVLLRALAELPDNVLWLAGDGPEEAALRELATALNVTDRVRFLGWREDGPALLAASDVLVSSSRHEPLGNVVLEGWVRGVPVVACASDGPAHLITHGESGLLCPIEDPSALAAEIRLVLEDDALYRRLSAGGRAAHEADYSEAAVVGRYVNFFKEITASS